MQVYYAHEHPAHTTLDLPWKSGIFLAGPSPRGKEDHNWRPEALELLNRLEYSHPVYVPLPRTGEWSSTDYTSQINWELRYLRQARVIAFWIPRDLEHLPGFTTNVEFGMYLNSGKIVLGYPDGAAKMSYLHYVARLNDVPIFDTLERTIQGAFTMDQNKGGS